MERKHPEYYMPYFLAAALGTAMFLLVFLGALALRAVFLAVSGLEIFTVAGYLDCLGNVGPVFLAVYLAPLLALGAAAMRMGA